MGKGEFEELNHFYKFVRLVHLEKYMQVTIQSLHLHLNLFSPGPELSFVLSPVKAGTKPGPGIGLASSSKSQFTLMALL